MFADFGGALPVPTQIVINLSNLIQNYFILIIVAIFVSFLLSRKSIILKKDGRRLTIGRLSCRFSNFDQKGCRSQVCTHHVDDDFKRCSYPGWA